MGHDLLVFALASSGDLGRRIAVRLGGELAPLEERTFEDGEHKSRPMVSVRGRDVFVVQSLYGDAQESVNDKLCRLLFLIGALRDASAERVTAVVPYLCYARKDRQTKPRDPVTTRYVACLFEAVGVDRVVTLDVHNPAAFQNAFRCRTDHLEARPLFVRQLAARLGREPVTVVSPDAGGTKRAERFRADLEQALRRPVAAAFMQKERSGGVVRGDTLVGDVHGGVAVIVDDLICAGTTMLRAARACAQGGALRVHVVATHGLFIGADALWSDDSVSTMLVSDSAQASPRARHEKIEVVDIAPLLAGAIERIHSGGSLVELMEV